MWTVIETSMGTSSPFTGSRRTLLTTTKAIIIGCAPAFAGLIRRQFGTHDVSYNSRGYVKRSPHDIKMKSLESDNTNKSKRKDQELWTDGHGSEEALADLGV